MLTITPMMYRELADRVRQSELLDQVKVGDRIGIQFPGSWSANIIGKVCEYSEGVVTIEPYTIEPYNGRITEKYNLESYLLADCTILVARLTDCRVA
jgi:hypothetical protein